MLDELSTVEKTLEEILIDLIAERVMSTGVQASLTRGVKASLLSARGSRPSRVADVKRTKHQDDLANAKLIPSILPDYIPPPANVVNNDRVPRGLHFVPLEGDTHRQASTG
jgi:hypothetical protein